MRNRLYGLTATEPNWHRTKRKKEIIEMNTKNYNFLLDKNLIRVSIRFNRRTIVISMKVNLLVHIIYGANENGRMACGIKITEASRTKKWLIKLKKEKKKNISDCPCSRWWSKAMNRSGAELERGEPKWKKKSKPHPQTAQCTHISEHFNILYWLYEPFQW